MGLAWLSRVGAAPIEPLALVMRWSQRAASDHVARMAAAGWVRRVRLDFGDGSLLVITRAGVRRVLEEHDVPEDVEAGDELRDVSPTMRAHVVASAWTRINVGAPGGPAMSMTHVRPRPGSSSGTPGARSQGAAAFANRPSTEVTAGEMLAIG